MQREVKKMHIYCLTRGILSATKQWENDLAAQYLPFEVKNPKGKIEKHLAQLQVRPVNLYEIVCPKECENQVMGMLKPATAKGFGGKWGIITKRLVKFLGLKNPSTTWKPSIIPPGEGVSVMCLGTKDDILTWTKKKGANSIFDDGSIPRERL